MNEEMKKSQEDLFFEKLLEDSKSMEKGDRINLILDKLQNMNASRDLYQTRNSIEKNAFNPIDANYFLVTQIETRSYTIFFQSLIKMSESGRYDPDPIFKFYVESRVRSTGSTYKKLEESFFQTYSNVLSDETKELYSRIDMKKRELDKLKKH
jgi:hypothetical protein